MKRKVIRNVIFAFCEWETEQTYLQCLWAFSKVKIYTPKIGEINVSNFERQIDVIWDYLELYWINKININKYQIKVYYLVDIDTIKTKKEVNLIKEKFEQEWIKILFSNKNIELFILEHYDYYNKESLDYIKEIKKKEQKYKKWKSLETKKIFENIIENNLDKMKENIKKLKAFHESNWRYNIYDMNPYSEIIELIEYIEWISE